MSVASLLRRLSVLALIGLMGCDDGLPGVLPGAGLHEISILDKTVTIAAPQGYCIDPKTSVVRGDAVVVLIGRCTARGGVAAALVSLTVGAPASAGVLIAGPDALAKFFTSPAGRRLLARDGKAAHVAVTRALVGGNTLYLHVEDRQAGEYWRAITAIKGRLVTVSASGTEDAPLTPEQGLKLVQDTIRLLAERNPEAGATVQGG